MTRTRSYLIILALLLAALLASSPTASAKDKRYVALSPFTANTLADLGIKPVGIADTLGGQDRFSPRLKGVPRMALSHPNGPNLEQLAAMNPDVVFSSDIWNRGHAAMRRLGMKVEIADPLSVADVPKTTRAVAKAAGKAKAGVRLARKQQRDIRNAQKNIKTRPSVLLIMGVGRSPYAFLPNSWGADVVTKAGGRLLTEDVEPNPGGFAQISNEFVVAQNPDVIIAVPHGNPSDIPSIAEYMASNPAWQTTKAAQEKRVYVATGNSLLQAYTDTGRIIRDIRTKFLKNN